MRKFRVWCEMNHAWEEPKCLIDQDGKLFQYRRGDLEPLNPKNHHVQFFTGLLDKSGKEIYEGDIIHWPHLEFEPEIIQWDKIDLGWVADKPNKKPGSWLDNKCKIIGNIWENPEFLNAEEL